MSDVALGCLISMIDRPKTSLPDFSAQRLETSGTLVKSITSFKYLKVI